MIIFRTAIWHAILCCILLQQISAFVSNPSVLSTSMRNSVTTVQPALPESIIWTALGFPQASCVMPQQHQQFIDVTIDGGLLMWFLTFAATVAWLSTLPTPNRADSNQKVLEPATATALSSGYSANPTPMALSVEDRNASTLNMESKANGSDDYYFTWSRNGVEDFNPSMKRSQSNPDSSFPVKHYNLDTQFPAQSTPLSQGENIVTLDHTPETTLAYPTLESNALVKFDEKIGNDDNDPSIQTLKVDSILPPTTALASEWSNDKESKQRGQIVLSDQSISSRPERSSTFNHRLVFDVASTIEDRQAMYATARQHREEHLEHIRSNPPSWLYADEISPKTITKQPSSSRQYTKDIKLVKTSTAPKPAKQYANQDQAVTSPHPEEKKQSQPHLSRIQDLCLRIERKVSFWCKQGRILLQGIWRRIGSRRQYLKDGADSSQTRFLLPSAGPQLPLPLTGRPGPPSPAEQNAMKDPILD